MVVGLVVAGLIRTPAAGTLHDGPEITRDELQLSVRNHSMPLEALRYDITPVGLHYLLIHFDIPAVSVAEWRLTIGGRVERPMRLSLEEIKSRPAQTIPVLLECAGNGRSLLEPRPLSQPWLQEAVGNAEWTGTPLGPIIEEARPRPAAREVVFTGLDRGVQGGTEQHYERSLPIDEARADGVLLAYAVNGVSIPPQHGFPLRLIVPGWYGMAHVKWLRAITLIDGSFEGYQQSSAYHLRTSAVDPGEPVTRILPRALMVPPGIPDFMSRTRFMGPGRTTVEGRAWSGRAAIVKVEFSHDGGRKWSVARLGAPTSPRAWRRWSYEWEPEPGEHELCVRATDAMGNTQPDTPGWNAEGVMNNAIQRVQMIVGDHLVPEQAAADAAAAG